MLKRLLILTALTLMSVSLASAQAELLVYGAFTSSTIDANNPAQFYEFEGEAGDLVAIEAMPVNSQLDPSLSLLSSGQSTLAASNDDPFQPGSPDARMTYALPEAGTYTVLVQGEGGTTGQFLLRLDQLTPPETTPLTEGIITTASVSADLPTTAFTFDSSVASTVTVSTPTTGIGFVVEVRAPDGETVAVQRGPLVMSASTTVAPNSGIYTLIISSVSEGQSASVEIAFGVDDAPGEEMATLPDDTTATDTGVEGVEGAATPATDAPTVGDTGDDTAVEGATINGETAIATGTPVAPETTIGNENAAVGNAPENRCTVIPSGNAGVNVRQLPTTDSPVIASIPAGEFRFADGTDGAWIRLQGGGWVSSGVVEQSAACANLQTVQSEAFQATQQAEQQPVQTAPEATTPPESVSPIGERN